MTDNDQIRKPKNRREFFKWLIFEPILFKKYGDSLKRKEFYKEFFRSYTCIVLISVIIMISANLIISLLDLPARYPGQFEKEIAEGWKTHAGWLSKFIFLSYYKAKWLAFGLALGLALGLAEGLTGELAVGLAVGLALGLAFGLAGGLAGRLTVGLTVGLAGGLAGGLKGRLEFELAFGFAAGLVIGLVMAFAKGLNSGIGFLVGCVLFYFRLLPFYPIYFIKSHGFNLSNNPYRHDGLIWLPIVGLKSRLIEQSRQDPKQAFEFIDFLLQYRPKQKTLAMHLVHAATAGLWVKNNFNADILQKPPLISKDRLKFRPSKEWYQKLADAGDELVAAEQQSGIGYKLQYYSRYLNRLNEFAEITKRKESSRWNHYYFDALNKWLQMAQEEQERLKLTAKTMEPITRNIYRAGDPLTPEFDQAIFLGRRDLKEELQNKILSAPTMPMFLINGQRRVGKTSLLKFLPQILGARFKVVFIDLQPIGSIIEWLENIKKEFDRALKFQPSPAPAIQSRDWLGKWKELQNYLEEAAQKQQCKIILPFDEYEKAHTLFQKDPEAAANLLDAMRGFSQHQDKIVFLFVGAALFTELQNPHWGNYFVQAVRLKVDYLNKDETLKLIAAANLDYPAEIPAEIYRLTQGHPTLVQRICLEMVNIANMRHRKTMTMKDLEQTLENHIYQPMNGVTEIFWGQFCRGEAMKTTVRQIIDGQAPADKQSLFALKEHGFIIKEEDRYKMRVPIFAEWVRQFGDVVYAAP